MADVFISYKYEDRGTTEKIAGQLRRHALSVWWADEHLQGERVDDIVPGQIADAKAVVVLISRRSIDSSWVRGEVVRAGKKVVAARIDDIAFSEIPTPLLASDIIDLSVWNGRPDDAEFPKLLARCIELKIGQKPVIIKSGPSESSSEGEPRAPTPPPHPIGSTVKIGSIHNSSIGEIGTTYNFDPDSAAHKRRRDDDR